MLLQRRNSDPVYPQRRDALGIGALALAGLFAPGSKSLGTERSVPDPFALLLHEQELADRDALTKDRYLVHLEGVFALIFDEAQRSSPKKPDELLLAAKAAGLSHSLVSSRMNMSARNVREAEEGLSAAWKHVSNLPLVRDSLIFLVHGQTLSELLVDQSGKSVPREKIHALIKARGEDFVFGAKGARELLGRGAKQSAFFRATNKIEAEKCKRELLKQLGRGAVDSGGVTLVFHGYGRTDEFVVFGDEDSETAITVSCEEITKALSGVSQPKVTIVADCCCGGTNTLRIQDAIEKSGIAADVLCIARNQPGQVVQEKVSGDHVSTFQRVLVGEGKREDTTLGSFHSRARASREKLATNPLLTYFLRKRTEGEATYRRFY